MRVSIGAMGLCLLLVASCAPATEPEHDEHGGGALRFIAEAVRNAGIEIDEAGIHDLRDRVETVGVVAPEPGRMAHLRPLSDGLVTAVSVRPGDRVSAGRQLLEYDIVELGDLIGAYVAAGRAVAALEARRELTARYLERGRELFELEAIARRDLEGRDADHRVAEAELRAGEADLEQLAERMRRLGVDEQGLAALRDATPAAVRESSRRALRAPFAGILTEVESAPGEVIVPERPVATLVDTSAVWVLADVYERDLGRVREGWRCTVRIDAYPGVDFPGRIESVAEVVDPVTRTARAHCAVDNDAGRLRLEMFASVTLSAPEPSPTLAVPVEAVQEIDGIPHVFVVLSEDPEGGLELEARPVELGVRREQRVEILSGLEAGARVVAAGSYLVASQLLRERIGGEH